ncbi:hypothetical protein LG329_01400 [Virgibacillus necropolis]|uniref:TIGR04104 family putative zinc finger protein n=1 Tax=Virgibacillus necropolis TaxID=163877 RepID=UPI00384C72EC
MPTCQKCQRTWSSKATIRTMFTFRMRLKCPYCGETQFLAAKSRKLSSFMSMPFTFIWFLLVFFQVSLVFIISYVVIAFLALFLIMPVYYEITNEEEALW